MIALIRTHLTGLARAFAELKSRARKVVAGELGRAIGEAVQQVFHALVAGRVDPPRSAPTSAQRPVAGWEWDDEEDARWGSARHLWSDDEDDGRDHRDAALMLSDALPAPAAGVTSAVAAGLYAARWWLGSRGILLAPGLGLGVGLLGVLGGPAARSAVAVLAAAADILGVTDALGAGAARLGHA